MLKKIGLLILGDNAELVQTIAVRFLSNPNIVPHTAADLDNGFIPDIILVDGDCGGNCDFRRLMSDQTAPFIVMSAGGCSEKTAFDAGAAGYLKKPKDLNDCTTFCSLASAKIIFAFSQTLRIQDGDEHKNASASHGKPSAKAPTVNDECKSDIIHGGEARVMSETCGKTVPVMPDDMQIAGVRKAAEKGWVVALGASTGGTDALECVIRAFPECMPPVVVVQHMPPVFTKLYAERLDRICTVHVCEAKNGMRLEKGMCVIGAGGFHLTLKKDADGFYISSMEGEKVSGHCSSVDVLFSSVADIAGKKAVGAIMTGMGADGARGLLKMHSAGAYTIGQDKASCIVYGIPMKAYRLGACSEQRSLREIGVTVCDMLGKLC